MLADPLILPFAYATIAFLGGLAALAVLCDRRLPPPRPRKAAIPLPAPGLPPRPALSPPFPVVTGAARPPAVPPRRGFTACGGHVIGVVGAQKVVPLELVLAVELAGGHLVFRRPWECGCGKAFAILERPIELN